MADLPPTDPELAGVLKELTAREPIFHRPEFGTMRSDFEGLTVPDFCEVGASGRQYSRDDVLDVLTERYSREYRDEWQAKDFRCRRLCESVYLLTYTLVQDNVRLTRRSTIWQRAASGWKIVYHQGTIVQPED